MNKLIIARHTILSFLEFFLAVYLPHLVFKLVIAMNSENRKCYYSQIYRENVRIPSLRGWKYFYSFVVQLTGFLMFLLEEILELVSRRFRNNLNNLAVILKLSPGFGDNGSENALKFLKITKIKLNSPKPSNQNNLEILLLFFPSSFTKNGNTQNLYARLQLHNNKHRGRI